MQLRYLICSYFGRGGWFLRDCLVWHLLFVLFIFLILGNFLFSVWDWPASVVLLYVRVRRLGAFGFLWEKEQLCEM